MIRGDALSLITGHKRDKQSKINNLEREVWELEQGLITGNDTEARHKLNLKLKEYRDESTEAAKSRIRTTQYKVYEIRNKANKLLAWLDKRDQEQRWVLELHTDTREIVTDRQGITTEFATYFALLYTSSTKFSPEKIKELLRNIALPIATHAQTEQLELDITTEEVE